MERLFSTIRTLTHSRNCDLLELIDRLKASLQINKIFTENPEFKHNDRLSISIKTDDHSSARDWIGDLNCSEISLSSCWRLGKKKSIQCLIEFGYNSDFIFNSLETAAANKSTMLKPKGEELEYTQSSLPDDNCTQDSLPDDSHTQDDNPTQDDADVINRLEDYISIANL